MSETEQENVRRRHTRSTVDALLGEDAPRDGVVDDPREAAGDLRILPAAR
jgi:hypothetical protein